MDDPRYLPEIGHICYEEMTRLAQYLRAHFPEACEANRMGKTVDTAIAILETVRLSPVTGKGR